MAVETPKPGNDLRRKAAEAGMTPEKFVALSGKTSLEEWEAANAAERKAAEAGGGVQE
jgi:hypothetical protein